MRKQNFPSPLGNLPRLCDPHGVSYSNQIKERTGLSVRKLRNLASPQCPLRRRTVLSPGTFTYCELLDYEIYPIPNVSVSPHLPVSSPPPPPPHTCTIFSSSFAGETEAWLTAVGVRLYIHKYTERWKNDTIIALFYAPNHYLKPDLFMSPPETHLP